MVEKRDNGLQNAPILGITDSDVVQAALLLVAPLTEGPED